MAMGGIDGGRNLEELDIRALRQSFLENNRHLEQCQRAIDIQREQMEMLTSEMKELRTEVRTLRSENRTLKQVNRIVWYLARTMSRDPYDLLLQRLEMDAQFREDLANLVQDPMNINELTQEFLNRYPQFRERKCFLLRCLRVCCCCNSSSEDSTQLIN